jgi:3-keto-disaccharide hydrolase
MNHPRYSAKFELMATVALALAGAMTTASAQTGKRTENFDQNPVGSPPAGWTATQTGKGEGKWAVVQDNTAPSKPNVLKQSGVATFPVCIKDDANLKDGFVEVKFKPVSGKEDQAGGVIWRARDSDNYYIFRANANEDNAVLYKTVNGKRSSLDIVGRKGGYGMKEKVESGQWHTLRVEFEGNLFKAFFDGKHMFDVEDKTFTEGGKVGVWTKADSVTLFDDFSYGPR